MTKQLSKDVFYGNCEAPFEPLSSGKPYPYKAIINVGHNIPNEYWEHLQRLPWNVSYFRMALRDEDSVNDNYMESFARLIDCIQESESTPILCHCLAGLHRGPTAALHAEYIIGMDSLEEVKTRLYKLSPTLPKIASHPDNRYHTSTINWLKSRADT